MPFAFVTSLVSFFLSCVSLLITKMIWMKSMFLSIAKTSLRKFVRFSNTFQAKLYNLSESLMEIFQLTETIKTQPVRGISYS